jgi:carbamoyltransferase
MNILGIGGYSHDSAAALLVDGKLVAAVAEERLSRIKHQGGPPKRAVQFCLDTAGITLDDVDHVTCYMKPGMRLARRVPYRLGRVFQSPYYALAYAGYEAIHNAQYVRDMRGLCGSRAQLHYMEHHPAHAASAFLVSPFDKAALLSIDYVGEWNATWTGFGEGTKIRAIDAESYPHSLGVFYTAITDYLGFARASDEYKVMGLASYGEPEFLDTFREIVRVSANGSYRLDLSWFKCHYMPGPVAGYFSDKFVAKFGVPRKKGEEITVRHKNIAASAQRVLEEAVLALANRIHKQTGESRLCMAGGVALNCSMNGRLLRESPFKEIFIQPAAGDDGIAIGGAMQLHHALTGAGRGFELKDPRLGPEYTSEQIQRSLDLAKLPYEKPASITGRTAELLAQGMIVGWYQGRMEFGPRALGARSILADPTRQDMKDLINKYVKHREEFRPFAPSCLEEHASEYFEGCTRSPFMLFTYKVKPDQRDRVPAITHIDGTARVQTVSSEVTPEYHALIRAFERLRGVPMVLNTSFNVMGEPIVNTPEDAVRCFYSTGMDALAIGDFVLVKEPRRVP